MLLIRQKPFLKGSIVLLTTAGIALFLLTFSHFAGVTSGLFSWTLNFSLMFWITVVESQLQPSLNSTYYNAYPFEKNGRIYSALGVHWFRRLLVISSWEKLNRKNNPVRKTLPALQQSERATRVSEFGHLVIAIIVFAITIFVCLGHSVKEAFWLILFNVLLNIYPMFVQRYNRPRLQRLIKELQQVSTV